ncbi:MAG: hypothetical protein ACRD3B_04810 [Candidatus Sulfotelmatobacter sp.]
MNWAKVVALAFSLFITQSLTAQTTVRPNHMKAKSDRDQEKLRGPVKSFTTEHAFPIRTDAQGNAIPEVHFTSTTEFDLQGHNVLSRNSNSDGSTWINRHTYDESGRLLKDESGTEGQALTVTSYAYDAQGRLQSVNGSSSPVSFHYDEHGRKTEIKTLRPEDYRGNVASGLGPFDSLQALPNIPGGGTSTTIYDDQDRPAEVQLRNDSGDVVRRAVRNYDDRGNVIQEEQIQDRSEAMFPPEVLQQTGEQSGRSLDDMRKELREQLTKLMGGNSMYRLSYRYDDLGRLTHTSRRIFNMQSEIETTYNDHGDVESEITRDSASTSGSLESPTVHPPGYSESRYSYQYDSFGNWTEQSISYRNRPDEPFQGASTTKRTLTYY